jgi:hypothetical protein
MTKAVALLTAWAESTDGDLSLTEQLLASYWSDAAAGGTHELLLELTDLWLGLLSLSERLLVELSHATGRSADELLEMIGRRVAQGR